uniref:Putative tnf receptor-associated factor 6 n=1 Tax=Ixodes ricinus TaxID=34613 RepID=A0A147BGU8_IXORI
MAATCATLSTEFLPGVDWRPLHFEHPLPPNWACQVCGVVSKETVDLLCSHTLCNVCFEASVALGCVCPLDRDVFDQERVDKLRLRPGQLLKVRVLCWNSANGCNFVGPVAELLDHFEKDCPHHTASCPGCHRHLPRQSLAQHCLNDCDPARSAQVPPSDVSYQERLTEGLEKASSEIKQSISELKDSYYELQTSVNVVAQNVNLGRSQARQAVAEAVSGLLGEIQASQPDMSPHGRRLLQDMENASTEMKQTLAELKLVASEVKRVCSEDKKTAVETNTNVQLGRSIHPGVGCNTPKGPKQFIWPCTPSSEQLAVGRIESDRFVLEGREVFFSITFGYAIASPVETSAVLRFHFPTGLSFRGPFTVRIASAAHESKNIHVRIDPRLLCDPRQVDLYSFQYYPRYHNLIDMYFDF